jgi:hypothetical protein
MTAEYERLLSLGAIGHEAVQDVGVVSKPLHCWTSLGILWVSSSNLHSRLADGGLLKGQGTIPRRIALPAAMSHQNPTTFKQ